MPEDVPTQPSPAPIPEPGPASQAPPSVDLGPGPGINIAEEFGTAKRNLPPAKIVLIVLGVAAVLLGIFAFVDRAKPQGGGSVDNITAVEVPDQHMVMVAINVTVHNSGEKSLWIHDIKAKIATDSRELSDEAASAMDFDRYFQAFPALKERALAPLPPETKIPPGGQAQGTIVVTFPVTQDGFDKRKSLSVVIQPYDQPLPLVLTK
ncbi:MAG: hypothetical protein WA637_13435 [Terriglobales bacterium]